MIAGLFLLEQLMVDGLTELIVALRSQRVQLIGQQAALGFTDKHPRHGNRCLFVHRYYQLEAFRRFAPCPMLDQRAIHR